MRLLVSLQTPNDVVSVTSSLANQVLRKNASVHPVGGVCVCVCGWCIFVCVVIEDEVSDLKRHAKNVQHTMRNTSAVVVCCANYDFLQLEFFDNFVIEIYILIIEIIDTFLITFKPRDLRVTPNNRQRPIYHHFLPNLIEYVGSKNLKQMINFKCFFKCKSINLYYMNLSQTNPRMNVCTKVLMCPFVGMRNIIAYRIYAHKIF